VRNWWIVQWQYNSFPRLKVEPFYTSSPIKRCSPSLPFQMKPPLRVPSPAGLSTRIIRKELV
jgi:hypothetical protein